MTNNLLLRASMVGLASAAVVTASSAQGVVRAPLPLEPVPAVLEAFRSYSIVAIGEVHGSQRHHAFLRSLIRDPRFAATVNDIVVEFGNALYQDLIDRYIRGEDVPYESLRRAWLYTTVGNDSWSDPIYEAFYREVRAVNAALPLGRQIRVLLGDPAVDWEAPDLGGWVRRRSGAGVEWPTPDEVHDRDHHAVSVIRSEVLARGRRALVLYGYHHVLRGDGYLVGILERRFATKTFAIVAPVDVDLGPLRATWPTPSLTLLRGTTLGLLDTTFVLQARRRENSLEANFDALLYLGRP